MSVNEAEQSEAESPRIPRRSRMLRGTSAGSHPNFLRFLLDKTKTSKYILWCGSREPIPR